MASKEFYLGETDIQRLELLRRQITRDGLTLNGSEVIRLALLALAQTDESRRQELLEQLPPVRRGPKKQ